MLMEKAEDKVWLFNDCEKNETEKAYEGQLSSSSSAGRGESSIEVLLQQKVSPSLSYWHAGHSERSFECSYGVTVNEAMLSFRIMCGKGFSSITGPFPTLICSQNSDEKKKKATKIRLHTHIKAPITTRWRRVFCFGSSACRIRCWPAAAPAPSPR